jgi:hypothetical protein
MAEFANELSDQSNSEEGPLAALSGVAAEPGDVRPRNLARRRAIRKSVKKALAERAGTDIAVLP